MPKYLALTIMIKPFLYCLSLFLFPPDMNIAPLFRGTAIREAVYPMADSVHGRHPPVQRAETWVYAKTSDGQGKPIEKASVTSPDRLNAGFPYNTAAIVTFTLRRTENGTIAYLQVSQGQFNSSYQRGSVRIRFDGQPWKTYAYSPAANGTGTTIFFDSVAPLIAQLKWARRMTIEVAFNGQSRQQASFPVAGLRWNP